MADVNLAFTHRQDEIRHVFLQIFFTTKYFFIFYLWYISIYIYVAKSKKQRRGMAPKKKEKKNYGEIKRTDGNTMKEEEREERDRGFCELLIKPTRNCWRDVYGFIVPFSRALKRPMQWTFCAVKWRPGRHGGRFVEFLDAGMNNGTV